MRKVLKQSIYLDNNSSTSLDPQVVDYIVSLLPTLQANPSSGHLFGQKIRNEINLARKKIADFFEVKANEVIFTSGGTESANLGIRGILPAEKKGHIITSNVEHPSVYKTIKYLEMEGYSATYLSPGPYGAIRPEAVKQAVQSDTQLIALMAVNNETGVKTDLEAIADIARASNILLYVDGVALLGKEPFFIPKGVSSIGFSGHKIHAPSGIGVLIVRSGTKFSPLFCGGGQEFGRRAGTENVLGILALAKAIEILDQIQDSSFRTLLNLREVFEEKIFESLPKAHINGLGPRTSNVSNIAFPGIDGETLLFALNREGIFASHGSACSSGALEPSRILLNMEIPLNLARSSLRFSLSRFTTMEEVISATDIIVKTVKRLYDYM